MLGLGGEDWEDQYKQALQYLAQVQTPEFNQREIAPTQLGLVGEYQPQTYGMQLRSEDPATVAGSPDMRAQQLAALEHLADYTGKDLPLSEALATQDIQRAMGAESSRLTDSAMNALAMRGNLGGGQEATLRAAANQSAMERARGMGSDLTQQAIQARLQALGMGSDIAGQVRGQDLREQGYNANAMNRFNEWVSQLGTRVAEQNAASRQGALNQTLAERQRIADFNKMNIQGTQESNLERQNRLMQQDFSNEFSKAQAQAQAATGYGGALGRKEYATQQNLINLGKGAGGLVGGLLPWGK
jgi:hypothetical protein